MPVAGAERVPVADCVEVPVAVPVAVPLASSATVRMADSGRVGGGRAVAAAVAMTPLGAGVWGGDGAAWTRLEAPQEQISESASSESAAMAKDVGLTSALRMQLTGHSPSLMACLQDLATRLPEKRGSGLAVASWTRHGICPARESRRGGGTGTRVSCSQ